MQPRYVSRWYVLGLLVGGLVFGGLWPAWGAPKAAYTLTDLGAYAHPISIDPDSATVAGRRFVSESPRQQGVVWAPTATIIPPFPVDGPADNEVTGICGNIIVGNSGHAYRRTNGQFEDLGTMGVRVAGVNCAGIAVGYNPSLTFPVPLVWTGTPATILPMLAGRTTGYALAINAHGDIIGESRDTTGESHCTYWPVTGGVVDCHTPGVATRGGSLAQGINNAGQVVGQAGQADGSSHGFVWLPHTGMLLLPPLPGDVYSAAWGINDAGVIVGASENASYYNKTPHAVRWDNGKPTDLLPLVTNAQGWTFDHAIAINNKGVIIGEGSVNGEGHGFILTPQTPEAPVPLVAEVYGDFNGDGIADLAGMDAYHGVWRCGTGDFQCTYLGGWVSSLGAGDLDGDGRDDLAALSVGNTVWVMTDGATWRWIPGWLSSLVVGDFYGDGHAQLAGLGYGNSLWRSPTLGQWEWVPGWLSVLVAGDFDGDGRDDLAGIGLGNGVWMLRAGHGWEPIPAWLSTLVAGDFDGDGRADLAGIGLGNSVWLTRDRHTWEPLPGWLVTLTTEPTLTGQDDLIGENGVCTYRMHTVGQWTVEKCQAVVAQQ